MTHDQYIEKWGNTLVTTKVALVTFGSYSAAFAWNDTVQIWKMSAEERMAYAQDVIDDPERGPKSMVPIKVLDVNDIHSSMNEPFMLVTDLGR